MANSKTSVVAAIGGNSIIMVGKLTAFAFSGSGAMLSEGIHSLADVLNQILLLVGIQRADKKADGQYAYGYAREVYIWALISAVGIFFLGCGVTVYHGIQSLLHPPEQLTDLTFALVVLLVSLLIEGGVLTIAYRELKRAAGDKPFFQYLKSEADPSGVAVLLEDCAACVGVLIALTGLVATHLTGNVLWDAVATLAIGLLLGAVAIWLIIRNHAILIGPSIPAEVQARVRFIINNQPSVESIKELKTVMLDNNTYDIMADIEFHGDVVARALSEQIETAYPGIQSLDDFKKFAATYADDVIHALGDEIDALEATIREAVPQAKFLDIEAN